MELTFSVVNNCYGISCHTESMNWDSTFRPTVCFEGGGAYTPYLLVEVSNDGQSQPLQPSILEQSISAWEDTSRQLKLTYG
jgi:hypothetical protein